MNNSLEEILVEFIKLAGNEMFRARVHAAFYSIKCDEIENKYTPLIKDAEKLLKKIKKNKKNKDE